MRPSMSSTWDGWHPRTDTCRTQAATYIVRLIDLHGAPELRLQISAIGRHLVILVCAEVRKQFLWRTQL